MTSDFKATIDDLDEVLAIINDAKATLKASGSMQWNTPDGYPSRETMLNDIKNGSLYVVKDNNIISGIIVILKEDENYNEIDGSWSSDNYISLHRIAVKKEYYHTNTASSLINLAISYAKENNYKSIRVDTHKLNKPMIGLLEKCSFKYRGIIKLKRTKIDNLRNAYELVL